MSSQCMLFTSYKLQNIPLPLWPTLSGSNICAITSVSVSLVNHGLTAFCELETALQQEFDAILQHIIRRLSVLRTDAAKLVSLPQGVIHSDIKLGPICLMARKAWMA